MKLIKRIILSVLLVLSFSNCYRSSFEEKEIEALDLSETEWSIEFNDNPAYASPGFSHQTWTQISIPSNLRKLDFSHKGVIWLRKSFDIDPDTVPGSLAILIGKLYDRDEVYLNGRIIGINGSLPDDINQNEVAFGRPRVYPIPAETLVKGQNIIAIKIISNFKFHAGIISGPLLITSLQSATDYLIQTTVDDVIFEAIYLFIGVFFLISFLKMKEMKEYLAYSIFIIVLSFYHFTRSEIRFEFMNKFLIYKYLEHALLLNLPLVYLNFFQKFFKLEPFRYQKYYLIANGVFCLLLLIIPNYVFWNTFINIWMININLILFYSAYETIKLIKENKRDAVIYLLGLSYLIYSSIKEILLERGLLQGESSFDWSLLIFTLFITMALRLRFIVLKIQIQNRFDELKGIDRLREKIFIYMDKILMPSIDESILNTRALKNNADKTLVKESLTKVDRVYSEMNFYLDDIFELSRLEVVTEAKFKDTVSFVDFIKVVLSQGNITYTIKVDPNVQIHNSLELVNSLIIRLIDFSGFKDIKNIDLILTSDLKGQLHFRFMLYSNDPRKTQKLYKRLSDYNIAGDIISVRWGIIKEILRLLNGHLEIRLINKKYMRIDFELQAMNPESIVKEEKPPIDWKAKLKLSNLKTPKIKIPKINLKLPTLKK